MRHDLVALKEEWEMGRIGEGKINVVRIRGNEMRES